MPTGFPFARKRGAVVLLASVILLSSCQQRPALKSTQRVVSPTSPLLAALMQRTEVTGNWVWYWDDLYQANETSDNSRERLVDAAARSVTGDYGTAPYLDFIHSA